MPAPCPNQVILGALAGTRITPQERDFIKAHPPAGVTLFRRNIDAESARQVVDLIQEFQDLRPQGAPPFIVAVDQEGGRVRRLRAPFPDAGPPLYMAGSGQTDPAALAVIFTHGQTLGTRLKRLGFNVNFAPVADCYTNPENTAIGDRCFGATPEEVVLRAGAFLKGLQSTGVWGCLKHFPGQGDATVDTHHQQANILCERAILESRELKPFRELCAQVQMVMTSHCRYPAFDPEYEASLSAKIMQGLLQQDLQYQGLIVTDDMTMGAIAEHSRPWTESIGLALAHGSHLILVCQGLDNWQQALGSLQKRAEATPSFATTLRAAGERVHALRTTLTA